MDLGFSIETLKPILFTLHFKVLKINCCSFLLGLSSTTICTWNMQLDIIDSSFTNRKRLMNLRLQIKNVFKVMVHIEHNKTMKFDPFKRMHESFIWWCYKYPYLVMKTSNQMGWITSLNYHSITLLTNQTPTTPMHDAKSSKIGYHVRSRPTTWYNPSNPRCSTCDWPWTTIIHWKANHCFEFIQAKWATL
jgi:hypothetical protein